MRKGAIVLGIVASLIVLVLIGAWLFLDVNKYRGLIQTQLEQQLGRKVTLGTMSLGLLPLRFQVAEPVIDEDPRLQQQAPFVRAENLEVEVGLLSLIRRNVEVH